MVALCVCGLSSTSLAWRAVKGTVYAHFWRYVCDWCSPSVNPANTGEDSSTCAEESTGDMVCLEVWGTAAGVVGSG